MLFKNDVFKNDDGSLHRLLHADAGTNAAWVISLSDPLAWPTQHPYSDLAEFEPAPLEQITAPGTITRLASQATPGQQKRARSAMDRIAPLVSQTPDIFIRKSRARLVEARAQEISCSEKTLFTHLREYWQGGQTLEALLGRYDASGRSEKDVTAGRGCRPKYSSRDIYQLQEADIEHFKAAAEGDYLKDDRRTIAATYRNLLSQHYTSHDGNGRAWILPEGKRPTLKQFEHFLRKKYNIEVRLRSRKGDKEFEREHRAKLGTVAQACNGVGHIYEIDATIADLWLVARDDPNKIIGKATLYLVIDRRTFLIVGFYLGLENPSWIGAMQAILSISADKAALCRKYGVVYAPKDWPADGIFPEAFAADRGEMLCNASNQVSDDLQTTVINLPALRPDQKPLVECGFKLTHEQIKEVAPGYDPPSNATRRRGKHYEKDACLTIDDMTKIILEAIIAHNRMPMKRYERTIDELHADIEPSPVSLWNLGVRTRAGLLTRYTPERVRFALLPRDKSVVTEMGLFYKGCYYTCPEAVKKGWFVKARKGRFTLDISYDPRLVDAIYVHDAGDKTQFYVATLTARSEKFQGMSSGEVAYYEWLARKALPEIEQARLQVSHEYRESTAPTVADAKARLKSVKKVSRSARKADTREVRLEERKAERQQSAVPLPRQDSGQAGNACPGQVISLVSKTPVEPPSPKETPQGELTLADKLKLAKQRMLNG